MHRHFRGARTHNRRSVNRLACYTSDGRPSRGARGPLPPSIRCRMRVPMPTTIRLWMSAPRRPRIRPSLRSRIRTAIPWPQRSAHRPAQRCLIRPTMRLRMLCPMRHRMRRRIRSSYPGSIWLRMRPAQGPPCRSSYRRPYRPLDRVPLELDTGQVSASS